MKNQTKPPIFLRKILIRHAWFISIFLRQSQNHNPNGISDRSKHDEL